MVAVGPLQMDKEWNAVAAILEAVVEAATMASTKIPVGRYVKLMMILIVKTTTKVRFQYRINICIFRVKKTENTCSVDYLSIK